MKALYMLATVSLALSTLSFTAHAASPVVLCTPTGVNELTWGPVHDCNLPPELTKAPSFLNDQNQVFRASPTYTVLCDNDGVCKTWNKDNQFAGLAPRGTYQVAYGYHLIVDEQGDGQVYAYDTLEAYRLKPISNEPSQRIYSPTGEAQMRAAQAAEQKVVYTDPSGYGYTEEQVQELTCDMNTETGQFSCFIGRNGSTFSSEELAKLLPNQVVDDASKGIKCDGSPICKDANYKRVGRNAAWVSTGGVLEE